MISCDKIRLNRMFVTLVLFPNPLANSQLLTSISVANIKKNLPSQYTRQSFVAICGISEATAAAQSPKVEVEELKKVNEKIEEDPSFWEQVLEFVWSHATRENAIKFGSAVGGFSFCSWLWSWYTGVELPKEKPPAASWWSS